ncbi:primary replicative DNA helicase [Streptomyces zhaozhouensis]|uniref:DNA 5'-3' helicase n=1 Tax=Streptomyces zhaozhouensis TaxID=1300267 RepID=A0A286E971_9ACTN|nr:replicative DNA helicase [Streptomyces zhaozhouensis]SOD67458.1 primary replicative DNA helicase [Streptomyces zhaozhouensis]
MATVPMPADPFDSMSPQVDPMAAPPYDEASEAAMLGGMMQPGASAADAVSTALDALQPLGGAALYRPAHQTIYEVITALYLQGRQPDVLLVTAELERRGDLAKVGGAGYVHQLAWETPSAGNIEFYAERVRDLGLYRQALTTATRVAGMAHRAAGSGVDLREFMTDAAGQLLDLLPALDVGADPAGWDEPVGTALGEWEAALEAGGTPPLPLPWGDLDQMLRVQPGHLVLVAGRPGMGKSVALLTMASHLAVTCGRPAALVSLEMTKNQLLERLMASEAEVPQHILRAGRMDATQRERYTQARERVVAAPLRLVVPPGGITVPQLRAQMRRWQMEQRLPEMLLVDYAQIITPASTTRGANRTNQVDEIARGLKNLALEYEIAVVAAAQLSRATTNRDDKTPQLSDLRESGELEQAADSAILLHREDYYDKESPRVGEIDMIVAKNRHGATGVVDLLWQGHLSRIRDFPMR